MPLNFSSEDLELLTRVLDRHAAQLRAQIAGSDDADQRDEMRSEEGHARTLLAQIRAARPQRAVQGEFPAVFRGLAA